MSRVTFSLNQFSFHEHLLARLVPLRLLNRSQTPSALRWPPLTLEGASRDTVVVNITGDRVSIVHSGIFLSGGIGANNILFNFVNATDVTLASSGAPVLGILGTALAPNASLHFANAHVTGGIFAKFLDADTAGDVTRVYADGQVNRGCFEGSAVDVGCGSTLPPPPKPAPTN